MDSFRSTVPPTYTISAHDRKAPHGGLHCAYVRRILYHLKQRAYADKPRPCLRVRQRPRVCSPDKTTDHKTLCRELRRPSGVPEGREGSKWRVHGLVFRRWPRNSGYALDYRTVKWRTVDGKLLLDLGKIAVFFLYPNSTTVISGDCSPASHRPLPTLRRLTLAAHLLMVVVLQQHIEGRERHGNR